MGKRRFQSVRAQYWQGVSSWVWREEGNREGDPELQAPVAPVPGPRYPECLALPDPLHGDPQIKAMFGKCVCARGLQSILWARREWGWGWGAEGEGWIPNPGTWLGVGATPVDSQGEDRGGAGACAGASGARSAAVRARPLSPPPPAPPGKP